MYGFVIQLQGIQNGLKIRNLRVERDIILNNIIIQVSNYVLGAESCTTTTYKSIDVTESKLQTESEQ